MVISLSQQLTRVLRKLLQQPLMRMPVPVPVLVVMVLVLATAVIAIAAVVIAIAAIAIAVVTAAVMVAMVAKLVSQAPSDYSLRTCGRKLQVYAQKRRTKSRARHLGSNPT